MSNAKSRSNGNRQPSKEFAPRATEIQGREGAEAFLHVKAAGISQWGSTHRDGRYDQPPDWIGFEVFVTVHTPG